MAATRDIATLYRAVRRIEAQLRAATTYPAFLVVQAKFEQIEAEWIALGEEIGQPNTHKEAHHA